MFHMFHCSALSCRTSSGMDTRSRNPAVFRTVATSRRQWYVAVDWTPLIPATIFPSPVYVLNLYWKRFLMPIASNLSIMILHWVKLDADGLFAPKVSLATLLSLCINLCLEALFRYDIGPIYIWHESHIYNRSKISPWLTRRLGGVLPFQKQLASA